MSNVKNGIPINRIGRMEGTRDDWQAGAKANAEALCATTVGAGWRVSERTDADSGEYYGAECWGWMGSDCDNVIEWAGVGEPNGEAVAEAAVASYRWDHAAVIGGGRRVYLDF